MRGLGFIWYFPCVSSPNILSQSLSPDPFLRHYWYEINRILKQRVRALSAAVRHPATCTSPTPSSIQVYRNRLWLHLVYFTGSPSKHIICHDTGLKGLCYSSCALDRNNTRSSASGEVFVLQNNGVYIVRLDFTRATGFKNYICHWLFMQATCVQWSVSTAIWFIYLQLEAVSNQQSRHVSTHVSTHASNKRSL